MTQEVVEEWFPHATSLQKVLQLKRFEATCDNEFDLNYPKHYFTYRQGVEHPQEVERSLHKEILGQVDKHLVKAMGFKEYLKSTKPQDLWRKWLRLGQMLVQVAIFMQNLFLITSIDQSHTLPYTTHFTVLPDWILSDNVLHHNQICG